MQLAVASLKCFYNPKYLWIIDGCAVLHEQKMNYDGIFVYRHGKDDTNYRLQSILNTPGGVCSSKKNMFGTL